MAPTPTFCAPTLAFAAAPAEKKKDSNFMVDFLIGGVSGAITKTAMNPVERVKMIMQTQDSDPRIISGELKRYTGISDCFKRVHAEQGLASFWNGNTANVLRYAPQQGSALAFNDALKQVFPKVDPKKNLALSLFNNLMSGGTAGAAAMVLAYPLDFARTRLATQVAGPDGKMPFSGTFDCIIKTVKLQGVSGLYRGTEVGVAGAFVYRAGQLGLFGTIMGLNPLKDDKGPIGAIAAFLAATIARSAILPFNYPFDTVRRRLMLESEKPIAERTYAGAIDCAGKVLKNEGLGGMYKGLGPEFFRGMGGSVVIVAYDRIKNWLGY